LVNISEALEYPLRNVRNCDEIVVSQSNWPEHQSHKLSNFASWKGLCSIESIDIPGMYATTMIKERLSRNARNLKYFIQS
jgi:hypothetical protein